MTQNGFTHKVPISNVSIFSRSAVLDALSTELAKIESSRKWKLFPAVFKRKVEEIQNNDRMFMLTDGIS